MLFFLFWEVRPPKNNNVVGSAPRWGRWRVTQSQKRILRHPNCCFGFPQPFSKLSVTLLFWLSPALLRSGQLEDDSCLSSSDYQNCILDEAGGPSRGPSLSSPARALNPSGSLRTASQDRADGGIQKAKNAFCGIQNALLAFLSHPSTL